MMKFTYQLIFSIRRLMADAKALFAKVVVFVLMILILGSVFKSSFESSTLTSITVAYTIEDDGHIGESMMQEMVENEEISRYLSFKEQENLADAEKLLANGQVDAIILVPYNFSELAMQEGVGAILDVYMTSYAGLNASVVKSCVEGFLIGMNSAVAVHHVAEQMPSHDLQEQVVEELAIVGSGPDSMTYYAIAMLLMLLFYGADYGNSTTAEEHFGALGDRMRLAPIDAVSCFVGRMLGISLVNFLQGCIVVIFSTLAFGVNWGDNIPLVLVILYVFSLLCTVFGAALCLLLGNEQKASGAIQMFALGFTVVSGGFYAGDFKAAKYLSFNHYAKAAINNLMFGGTDLTETWINLGILMALTMALSIVCIIVGRRRKVGYL